MARGRRPDVPDELVPAAIRLLMTHGPTAVMQAEWRDPDDDRPDARKHAKTVKGHRAYDPLRWSRRRHGDASVFSELHVHAADRLRLAFDTARLSGLPGAVWAGEAPGVGQVCYQPSSGPTAPALAMSRAAREYGRAVAIFSLEELAVIHSVVIHNIPVTLYVRRRRQGGDRITPQTATQRLVAALDKLVAHYDTEIKEDMAMGRVEA